MKLFKKYLMNSCNLQKLKILLLHFHGKSTKKITRKFFGVCCSSTLWINSHKFRK